MSGVPSTGKAPPSLAAALRFLCAAEQMQATYPPIDLHETARGMFSALRFGEADIDTAASGRSCSDDYTSQAQNRFAAHPHVAGGVRVKSVPD